MYEKISVFGSATSINLKNLNGNPKFLKSLVGLRSSGILESRLLQNRQDQRCPGRTEVGTNTYSTLCKYRSFESGRYSISSRDVYIT